MIYARVAGTIAQLPAAGPIEARCSQDEGMRDGSICGAGALHGWPHTSCDSSSLQWRGTAAAQGAVAGEARAGAAKSRGLLAPERAGAAPSPDRDLLSAYLAAGVDDSISRLLLMGGHVAGSVAVAAGDAVLLNFEAEAP